MPSDNIMQIKSGFATARIFFTSAVLQTPRTSMSGIIINCHRSQLRPLNISLRNNWQTGRRKCAKFLAAPN